MARSWYGSGARSKTPAIPCRCSTSTSSVRRPPAARARASAAATVVLPAPPLPVTTCSRADHLAGGAVGASGGGTDPRLRRSGRADVAAPPAPVVDEQQGHEPARDLLVERRHRERDVGRRLPARGPDRRVAPRRPGGRVRLLVLPD